MAGANMLLVVMGSAASERAADSLLAILLEESRKEPALMSFIARG